MQSFAKLRSGIICINPNPDIREEKGGGLLTGKTMLFYCTFIIHSLHKEHTDSSCRFFVNRLSIAEGFIQKRRQKSLLLLGDVMPHYLFSSKDDLKKTIWKNIHFGRVVAWYGVSWKIIHFSKASILPSVHFSIHPFLQIILALNL